VYVPGVINESTRSFAVVGSGGSGVITAGALLLEAAARARFYGLMTRSHGPQIRGGEAAAFVRLGRAPVEAQGDRVELLVVLDWKNAERFEAELRMDGASLVLIDSTAGDPPPAIAHRGARFETVDLSGAASEAEARPNVVAAGLLAAAAGIGPAHLEEAVRARMADKGAAVIEPSVAGALAGHALAADLDLPPPLEAPEPGPRWQATGNQLAGLGALYGGVRFAAGYPITPATDLLEWLAPRLPKLGGELLQAEDELAAIHAVLGAAWAGTPSMTATSGPGLALMIEALGYGVAAEIPALVVDVQRGGPSTGIPTKSEQGDLNMALHGLNGDAPHLVLAPSSVADCLPTVEWAARLAERLHVPTLVLSDQFLGQARAVIDPPARAPHVEAPPLAAVGDATFERYAPSADGVSPRSIPGMPGLGYTADGLEHAPSGTPSARPEDHARQLDKRRDKLLGYDYGERWADLEGEGDLAVVCFGSPTGAVREAIARFRAEGGRARLVSLRLLAPALPERWDAAMEGVRTLLVVEQTHGAQLHRYLRASYDLPARVRTHARPGPVPFTAGEIHGVLRDVAGRDAERSVA
jgi:2-oxoglutarate ferredoxin oxidoreductase subunit alpha